MVHVGLGQYIGLQRIDGRHGPEWKQQVPETPVGLACVAWTMGRVNITVIGLLDLVLRRPVSNDELLKGILLKGTTVDFAEMHDTHMGGVELPLQSLELVSLALGKTDAELLLWH